MTDAQGYFVNDTGKTIQELLNESNARTERGYFNLMTRLWDTFRERVKNGRNLCCMR